MSAGLSFQVASLTVFIGLCCDFAWHVHKDCGSSKLQESHRILFSRHCVGFDVVNGEGLVAPHIHVNVDPTVVMQNKIANRVCALDGEGVVVPDIHEPRVLFGGNEVALHLPTRQSIARKNGQRLSKLDYPHTKEPGRRKQMMCMVIYLVLEV